METRNYQAGAIATPPDAPVLPSNGYPSNGNPSSGQSATQPGAHWFYKIGEELRNLIVNAGLIPADGDLTQLYQAVKNLISSGGAIKLPVRVATTANIATLSGGAPSTLDDVVLVAGDRILVKDQTTASQNGIYVVATLGTGLNGTWTRATDSDVSSEIVAGMLVVVAEGYVAADTIWELTTDAPIVLGTTGLVFARKDGQTVTAVSDTTFVDNSSKAASTSWVRGAMSAIAVAAGFAYSFAETGYIKLPNYLGGFIAEWGKGSGSTSDFSITFPVTFPNACFTVLTTCDYTIGSGVIGYVSAKPTTTGFTARSSSTLSTRWIAVGY
jgi:phage-related tail fiber protein